MTEPMTDERLAEIHRIGYADDHDVIGELLAEVERLRQEDPIVAATREYVAKLKRGAILAVVYVVAGVSVWHACRDGLGLPSSLCLLACLLAGVPIGAAQAWIDDRREASRG